MCFEFGAQEDGQDSELSLRINPQGPQNRGRLRALIEGLSFPFF